MYSPRHGDVDDRAEKKEDNELGQLALHDNKGYSIGAGLSSARRRTL